MSTLQPELTNEVPLLVSDFLPDSPFREDPLLAGVDVPVEDRLLERLGAEATGAFATGVAGVTAAGATETGRLGEAAAVTATLAPAIVGLAARAGAVATLGPVTSIGGALLRASGIAAPADAADRLGGSLSAGVPAGLSARPIAKQQRNTITHSSIETANARA